MTVGKCVNFNQPLTRKQKIGLLNEIPLDFILRKTYFDKEGFTVRSNDFNNYASCQKAGVDHEVFKGKEKFLAIEAKGLNWFGKPYGTGKVEEIVLPRFKNIKKSVTKICVISYIKSFTKKDRLLLEKMNIHLFEVGRVLTPNTSRSFLEKLKIRFKKFVGAVKELEWLKKQEEKIKNEPKIDELVFWGNFDKEIENVERTINNIVTKTSIFLSTNRLSNLKLINIHDRGIIEEVSIMSIRNTNNIIKEVKKLEKLKKLKKSYPYLLRIPESWIV